MSERAWHRRWYCRIQLIWEAGLDLGAVLLPMRFSLIVLVLGGALLALFQQSQDALYVLAAGENLGPLAWFEIFAFLWAFNTFYAARFMSYLPAKGRVARLLDAWKPRPGQGAPPYQFVGCGQWPPLVEKRWIIGLKIALPRWLGASVIIVVHLALWRASLRLSGASAGGLAAFAAILALKLAGQRLAVARKVGWVLPALTVGALIACSQIRPPLPHALTGGLIVLLGSTWWELYWVLLRNRRWLINRAVTLPGPMRRSDFFQALAVPPRPLRAMVSETRRNPAKPRRRWLVWAAVAATVAALVLLTWPHEAAWGRAVIAVGAFVWLAFFLAAFCGTSQLPLSTKTFAAFQVLVIGTAFVLSLFPQGDITKEFGGAPAVVALAAAGWAFGGTLFLAYPTHRSGLPLGAGLIALSVLWGLAGFSNHQIRFIDAKTQVERKFVSDGSASACAALDPLDAKAAADDAFAAAFARWCGVASNSWNRPGPLPLIIVATAGGASRAAYWTEKVLSELEAAVPGFHNYVFAISSVSGGTLGSAVYRLSLDMAHAQPGEARFSGKACRSSYQDGNPAPCALAFLQRDYLSSLLLGGLYSDLVQHVLPGTALPDRGSALESAWQSAWSDVFPVQGRWFADGFVSRMNDFMTKRDQWRPIMLFNSTSVATGRRVIISNLPIDGHFSNSIDFFGWTSPCVPRGSKAEDGLPSCKGEG